MYIHVYMEIFTQCKIVRRAATLEQQSGQNRIRVVQRARHAIHRFYVYIFFFSLFYLYKFFFRQRGNLSRLTLRDNDYPLISDFVCNNVVFRLLISLFFFFSFECKINTVRRKTLHCNRPHFKCVYSLFCVK